MASITLYVPEQDPIAIDLDAYEQITVGRGPDNDLVLDHASLSGSHAVIRNQGGFFTVTDLGSTNGTFLDGAQISEAPLVDGSRVLFGSVDSIFSDGSGEAAAEAPAAEMGAAESSYGSHHATLAEVSSKPGGWVNLSPIEKVVKKDTIALVSMIVGAIGILAAIGLIVVSASMSAA